MIDCEEDHGTSPIADAALRRLASTPSRPLYTVRRELDACSGAVYDASSGLTAAEARCTKARKEVIDADLALKQARDNAAKAWAHEEALREEWLTAERDAADLAKLERNVRLTAGGS